MQTLPALPAATQIEADALAFACAWFRYWREQRESPMSSESFPK